MDSTENNDTYVTPFRRVPSELISLYFFLRRCHRNYVDIATTVERSDTSRRPGR